MVKNKRKKKDKPALGNYTKQDSSLVRIIDDIRMMKSVKRVIALGDGKRIKNVSKSKFHGPGIYFSEDFHTNRDLGQIPLLVYGTQKGIAYLMHVYPCNGNFEESIRELIGYRLDGYGKGLVTKDPSVGKMIAYLENHHDISSISRGYVRNRSQAWTQPGFYGIRHKRYEGTVTALIVGSKKPSAGLEVKIFPSKQHPKELIWDLKHHLQQ